MIVEDARKDKRFIDNPLVLEHKPIFYAGVPLINPEGYSLGALCIYDHKPRTLLPQQKDALKTLSKQVVHLFELRKQNKTLADSKKELELRNKQLKAFASHVSHDLKSPLANIMALTDLMKDDENSALSNETKDYVNSIKGSATILKDYIDGILKHYKSTALVKAKKEDIELNTICKSIKQLLFKAGDKLIYSNHKIEK